MEEAKVNQVSRTLALVVCLAAISPAVADIEFFDGFDGEYAPGVWTATLLTSGVGGSVNNTLITSGGGNPGNWRQTDVHINGSEAEKAAMGCFINTQAVYNPSVQGAIESIHYSEDQKMISSTLPDGTSGQRASVLLMQNGNLYYSFGVTGRALNWHEQLKDPIGSGSFSQINDPNNPGVFLYNSASHPDFTATGGPITFGYYRGNTDGATGIGGYDQSMGIDNWHVLIRTVPEPVSLALVSAGLVLLARRRR